MAKRKRAKGQTTIYNTLHIKQKIEAESNKVISVLAQTQVHMASKAF
jgi:hypothetical protein